MRRLDASALSPQSDSDQIYADSASAASVGSSPRSVSAKGSFSEEAQLAVRWDEPPSVCVKLMCSYGGRILPRPHDNQLRYVGGETRIVVVSRNITNGELTAKLVKIFGPSLVIKYQLPNEDLDALISVTSEEDLENMMEEYDRIQLAGHRSSKLRLFLFSPKVESQTSLSDLFESNQNRESWFVDALNGMPNLPRVRSESSSIVSDQTPDFLSGSGMDALDEWAAASNYAANTTERIVEKLPAPIRGYQLYSAPPPPSTVTSSVVDAAYKGQPTKSGAQVDNDLVHIAPGMRQRVSENQASGERQMPSMVTNTADTLIHVAKASPDQQAARSIDDDLEMPQPAKSGHVQGREEGSSSSKSRTGSQERASSLPSVVPPMGQQRSEAPMQPAKSNASSEDLELGIPRQVERIITSREELLVTTGDKSTANALDTGKLKVLGAQSDNRVREDPRNKLEPSEAEQSTSEIRSTDAAMRASSSNSTSPDASKSGDSVTMQQVSSYNNKETAAQVSSSPAVEPSLLNSAALSQSDPVRFAFYAQEEEEEEPTIPTYATQGPVIQLPIALSAPASSASGAPPAEAPPGGSKPAAQLFPVSRSLCPPVFAVPPQPVVPPPSAQLSPASHPISPPLLAVPPQPQLWRQAPSPSPLSTTDASSPTPAVTVYYSTAAYGGEGVPTAGIPMHSAMAQLQRHVSDPVAQHLKVPSPQRDYHAATATNTGPSMAALPSRFRGPPTLISNQQPQLIGSDRKPAGMRQTAGVPSPLPPLAPVQYSYNMEQHHTYPAARTRTAAIYDPSNATYTLAPTNLGATLPDTAQVTGVNPFSDEIRSIPPSDLSSFARTLYQDVHDASADEPQDTGAAGRQFFVRN